MRATRKAGEVPCAADYSGTYNAVAAGQSHNGREHTMTVLTWEWPDDMNGKLSGSPNFFFFRGGEYAHLNGPPVPHERLAQRSRHSPVKTSRIFTFGGVCGGDVLARPF
jgi:hypothetical protein